MCGTSTLSESHSCAHTEPPCRVEKKRPLQKEELMKAFHFCRDCVNRQQRWLQFVSDPSFCSFVGEESLHCCWANDAFSAVSFFKRWLLYGIWIELCRSCTDKRKISRYFVKGSRGAFVRCSLVSRRLVNRCVCGATNPEWNPEALREMHVARQLQWDDITPVCAQSLSCRRLSATTTPGFIWNFDSVGAIFVLDEVN